MTRYRLILVLWLGACATAGTGDEPDGSTSPFDSARPPPIDAGGGGDAAWTPRSLVHDDQSDFEGNGAATSGTAVTSPGTVAPVVFHTGGLLASASDTGVFTDAVAATWSDIQAMTPTGRHSVARLGAIDWGQTLPAGLGLGNADSWTQWYEGEVYLEAGSWTFYLLVDDHGFVDIAEPGADAFTRVASADWPNEATGPFTVAAAGWHPIRVAICDETLGASMQLRYALNGGNAVAIPRHKFRFRADDLQGWYMAGWDGRYTLTGHNVTIDQTAPADQDWGTGTPGDLGMSNADDFSVRWAGQFQVVTAGDYSFRLVTDDGQRMWINGAPVLDFWDDTTHDSTTNPINLDEGWHDFVVEHTEAQGGATARLSIASGPELAGSPLPLARTRPVVGLEERYDTGSDGTDYTIPDNGSTEASIVMTAPGNAVVTGFDVGWTFTHTYWGDLEIRVVAPNGSEVLLRDNVGGSSSGTTTEHYVSHALDGAGVNGTWRLRVADTVGLDTGTLLDFHLTVRYDGGEAPVPPSSTYDSRVEDLGPDLASYDNISWTESAPPGTDVELQVRTGATAEDCLAAPYSAALTDPNGSPLSLPAERHVQYRITFTSDGSAVPSVERVQLDYSTAN